MKGSCRGAVWKFQKAWGEVEKVRDGGVVWDGGSVGNGGSVENLKAQNHHADSVMLRILGKLAMKLGPTKAKENISPLCAMSFSSSIHSVAPLNSQSRPINSDLELNKDRRINSESGWNNNRSVGWNNNRPMNNLSGWSNRPVNFDSGNNTN
ncbi:hypothetical protein RJ639_027469 [Escallonia herrerae]|uniref:Uncharacterized protein n=1 Tax=Escallonia herrerae TaxID=1293975 RepID=A0AA89BD60_9ASTE|nr:hypothetical protein RJ639_027469 [Escallonia herrerae]